MGEGEMKRSDEPARENHQGKSPVMEQIGRLINDINFGEVVITIHDSKIVQLEKREKTRLRDG
jgi:hypothetical protein